MAAFSLVSAALLRTSVAAGTIEQCSPMQNPQSCARKPSGNALIQVTKRDNRDKDAPDYIYALGDAGTGDCPDGQERVLDQAECKAYAEKRDWTFAGANCYQMTEGCLNNTGNIYFSTCNYTTIDPHHSAVCRTKAAGITNSTPIAVATSTAPINATDDSKQLNTTGEANASNASSVTDVSNATENGNQTGQAEDEAGEVKTETLKLNWHRRRDGFARRRHQACGDVSEGFACPRSTSQRDHNFTVSHNGSTVCIDSDPDDGWEFDVEVNCTRRSAAEENASSAVVGSPATEQLFNVLDQDNDGSVTKEEFVGSLSD